MRPRQVLLVEDDALCLKLMRDVLQAHGYVTAELYTGSDVVAQATALGVDLVVMDIGLPGLDGVEATRKLKACPDTVHMPVLAVTAYAMPTDEARMRAAGCDAYLTKPLRFATFVTTVQDLVSASSADD